MNSAPAELLQLLTIAALQPWSSATHDDKFGGSSALFTSQVRLPSNEKAAMPEQDQAVRLCMCGKFACISV
jgi:hypothetical protein